MIELLRADDFIKSFEKRFSQHVRKIPLNYADGRSVLLLMCKCSGWWIALPYCSEAYIQTDMSGFDQTPPFTFVESSDGNLFCTKNIRWQIRDTRAWSSNVYAEKLNFFIRLTDDDPITLLNSDTGRKIRKALSSGIEVKSSGKRLIDDFYKVYSRRMYELGSPCASKRQIAKGCKQGDKIFVAYKDSIPVGAATLSRRDETSYENILFATDIHYNHLYTSYALHYAMMCHAQKQHASAYYLGRSTRHSSVHLYKSHYRPEERDLFWSYSQPYRNIRQKTYLRKLWRLLPLRLATLLGGIVNKRIY